VFETELFAPVMQVIAGKSKVDIQADAGNIRAARVVADHLRSSVFILGDDQGVKPGNLGQGYVLRRLIRRSVRYARKLGMEAGFTKEIAECVIGNYRHVYPELERNSGTVLKELVDEEARFESTLEKGMGELEKVLGKMKEFGQAALSGKVAFRLYDTYGFPVEFTEEICREQGLKVDREGFEAAFAKHREVSKQGSEKAFKGGLADHSVITTRLHTATHLLHKSLRMVLGEHVAQKGSNITPERLRFDFSHTDRMTPEQIQRVEQLVNEQIRRNLPVVMEVMTLEDARKQGAIALFAGKYEEQVKVYTAGDFSKEVCGGPHVANTGELGRFRILKEESSGAGVRRIRAVLE
jgi:alanyl-tRNA synthetase